MNSGYGQASAEAEASGKGTQRANEFSTLCLRGVRKSGESVRAVVVQHYKAVVLDGRLESV